MSDYFEYAPPKDAGLFGFQPSPEDVDLWVIGVPWEPTASYGRGTSKTPHAIVEASHQLDVYESFLEENFGHQVALIPLEGDWVEQNKTCIERATPILSSTGDLSPKQQRDLALINETSEQLNSRLEQQVTQLLRSGAKVAVLGGDHSSPFGSIRAHSKHWPEMGLLHIDAHHDLRNAYQGFTYSHASIMFNVLGKTQFSGPLVSVGIRDFSSQERAFATEHPKVITHYDRDLKRHLCKGSSWSALVENILKPLPHQVYISLDIDGLDPANCPHTGTPVPGGLSFDQTIFLLESILESGRQIIGFDLCEVAPGTDDWDLNVGSRILHKLAGLTCIGLE